MSPTILLSLLYCGAAFGGSFLFMRLAAPELPALLVAFGRVAFAALILAPFVGRAGLTAIRCCWRDYLVVGFFMAAAPFALFAFAERSITAGLGSILNATTPLWTVIVLAAWLRQPPGGRRIAAIAIGFAGVAVIVGGEGLGLGSDALLGIAAATAGAACYGVALTYMRRHMASQPPVQLALGQLIAATALLAPGALLSVGEATVSAEAVAAVAGLAILSTAIAWPLLFRVNRDVGPLATSTVTFLNPVFGTLWGALFLGETVSPAFLAGSLLVFASLALVLDLRLPGRLRGTLRRSPVVVAPAKLDE
ncbi:MAG: rane protein [Chloroflexi bacterium]|jgi:drug/metabolite transporter (DMT)-like permease|nr:rane protein [Chloroflexota bacterium]